MSDAEGLRLLWSLLGGDRGYHVLEVGDFDGERVDLRCEVDNWRRFERLAGHYSWAGELSVGVRPYVDRRSRRLFASSGCVWARVETGRQAAALAAFQPAPTLVLGLTDVHQLAFWGVNRALAPEDTERVGKHLAHKLGTKKKWAEWCSFPPPGAFVRAGRSRPLRCRAVGGSGVPYAIGTVCRSLPRKLPQTWGERMAAERAHSA